MAAPAPDASGRRRQPIAAAGGEAALPRGRVACGWPGAPAQALRLL